MITYSSRMQHGRICFGVYVIYGGSHAHGVNGEACPQWGEETLGKH